MTITRSAWTLALGAGAVLWLSGCSAAGEGAARTRWSDVRARHYEPAPMASGAEVGEPSTLDTLLALAARRNPGLRAAFDEWTAALQQVPQARALPDPKLSYAYFIEPIETRVGPQSQRIGISQTIPLFGKLGLRGEAAVRAANAAGAHFDEARLDLRYRITRIWSDTYYLHRAIAVTEENVDLLASLENVALAQYRAGRAPHAAVIRAQLELGRLEDRLRSLRDQRTPLVAALNAELNRPDDAPIAWPDSLEARPMRMSDVALRDALLRESPRLAALAATAEQHHATARLAGRQAMPDLTLGVELVVTDEARMPGVTDSGKDAALAMATINLPLWFGRYRAEKASADARASAAENAYEQARRRLLADLQRAEFELRDAERRMDLYAHTLIPRGRQSLAVTEEAFAAGSSDFLDLIDTQRTLLDLELAYERSLADRATAWARLEQVVGVDLDAVDEPGGTRP